MNLQSWNCQSRYVQKPKPQTLPLQTNGRVQLKQMNCLLPISSSRSNRPGRRNAGSSASGRFVAAITRTRFWPPSSISLSKVPTIRCANSSLPSLRSGAIASTSSQTGRPVQLLQRLLSKPAHFPHKTGLQCQGP
jgi:hypothetical protein